MNDLSGQLRDRVAALCPHWDPSALSGFLYLEGGYSNDNYRFSYAGERFVLRAPFRDQSDLDRGREQHIYAQRGLAGVPELVAFDPHSGDMISRWVEGTLLADRSTDADALVTYLQQLHSRLPDVTERYDPLAQARRQLEHAAAPLWLERLAVERQWAPEQAVTCHNDLNPWNVVCTASGDWVTLDWEWVGRNDPLFDLVTLHQGAAMPDAALPAMATRYLGVPPAPERLTSCLVVFWLRETTWALAEVARGNDRPEITDQAAMGLERLAGWVEPD